MRSRLLRLRTYYRFSPLIIDYNMQNDSISVDGCAVKLALRICSSPVKMYVLFSTTNRFPVVIDSSVLTYRTRLKREREFGRIHHIL